MKTSIQKKILSGFLLLGIVVGTSVLQNTTVQAQEVDPAPHILSINLSNDNAHKTVTNKDKNVKILSLLATAKMYIVINKIEFSKKDISGIPGNPKIANIHLKATGSTPDPQDFYTAVVDNKITFNNIALLIGGNKTTKLELYADIVDDISNEGGFYLTFKPREDIKSNSQEFYISNKTEDTIISSNTEVKSLKPDLQVNDIYFTSNNEYIHFDICNRGKESLIDGDYIISLIAPNSVNYKIPGQRNIPANSCYDLVVKPSNLKIDTSGEYHITAIVDDSNTIRESNEGNNVLFEYIKMDIIKSVLDGITDLRIVGDELYWTAPKNVKGYNITFYTGETSSNTGFFGGCSGDGDYDKAQLECSGYSYLTYTSGKTERLILKQNPIKSFIIKYQDKNGEISEASNVAIYKKTTSAPDLYVSGLSYGYDSSNNVVTATVCNKGDKITDKNTVLKVFTNQGTNLKTLTTSIPVGQCSSVDYSVQYDLGIYENGNYTVEAYVDPDNIMDELNENNNYFKTQFNITVKEKFIDLALEDIEYNKVNESSGEIRYKVCNRGEETIQNYSVRSKITANKTEIIGYDTGIYLASGECDINILKTQSFQIYKTGIYNVTAIIDSNNVLKENNESNNSLTENINVKFGSDNLPPISDLRIEDNELRWTAPSNEIVNYHISYYTGEIDYYNGNFGGCGYDMYSANGAGKYCAGTAYDITKTKGHLERLKLNSTSNTYIVSYTDQYGNSSTVSNSAYKKKQTEKPDLYINNLIYNPNNQKFEFQVCNQGLGDVEGNDIMIQTKANNEWVVNRGENSHLFTGGCFNHSEPIQNFGITKTGSYAINVKVDHNNTISKANENNNNLYKTLYVNLGTDPVVYFLGPKDLHVKFDEEKNPSLEWTNPGNATEFAVAIYTGEISDNEFYSKVKTYGYNYRPITEYDKRDSFRFDGSERNAPITVVIKLRDRNGIESSLSNIYRYYGYGTKNKFPAPPAGFEDEVITAYTNYTNPFPDTDLSKLEGKSAAELYRRAVIGGFPDGEFKGSRAVNRAELAKFLLLARYGAIGEYTNNGKFPDVLDGQWYVKYVVRAANLGIIQGYPDGTFGPEKTV